MAVFLPCGSRALGGGEACECEELMACDSCNNGACDNGAAKSV